MAKFGQVTVNAAAVQLVEDSTTVDLFTKIKSLRSNGNTAVYFGYDNSVTVNTGFELSKQEETTIPNAEVSDASGIWLIASAANAKVCYRIV